jgi:hypothetical protein
MDAAPYHWTITVLPSSSFTRRREQRQYYESFFDDFHKPMSPFRRVRGDCEPRVFNRLDYRSLNIDTFDPIYVLMGHALPTEAQFAPVQ